jgi:N-acetylglucosaminyl-diphospho-decaprenol L-rhamnosyltransferase
MMPEKKTAPIARPLVSIAIVTYQSVSFIDRCIAPLYASNGDQIEIVLVDNASTDGTVDHIRTHYPKVKTFASPENLGFSKGTNLALKLCTGRYLLMLNPDAFTSVDTVYSLAAYLVSHADVAGVGPQLLNLDGSHQVGDAGWRYSLFNVFAQYFFLHRLWSAIPTVHLSHPRLLHRHAVEVDWICGACLMTRREVIEEVGGLDERIFMYGEDLEWGERVRDAGYRVVYLPQIKVLHWGAGTQGSEGHKIFNADWMDNLAGRFAESRSRPAYRLVRVLLVFGFSSRAIILAVAGALMGRPILRRKAILMWKYGLHAFNLPSFDTLKKKAPRSTPADQDR